MLQSKVVLVRPVLGGAGLVVLAALGCFAGETTVATTGGGGSGSGAGGNGGSTATGNGGSSTTGNGGSSATGLGGAGGTGHGGSGGTGRGGAGGTGAGGDTSTGAGGDTSTGAGGDTGTGAGGAGGALVPTGVHVQYQCNDTFTGAFSSVGLHFAISNSAPVPLDLSTFTIRYWFTADGIPLTSLKVSCEQIQPSALLTCAMVKVTMKAADPPAPPATMRMNADSYVEVGFTADAGGIGWMGAIPQLDIRWQSSVNPGPMQGNDYSFGPTVTKYADYKKVTGYVNGTLIWGTEP
jgi:hypothetical protein